MANPAAVALGRLGGKAKSKHKAAAARKNGRKGGRPKADRALSSAASDTATRRIAPAS